MKQLVMMGLGEAFHKICDSAILQGMFPDGQILALCDSDASKAGEQYIINKKTYAAQHSTVAFWENARRQHGDFFVYITSEKHYDAIQQQLIEAYGIPEDRILKTAEVRRRYREQLFDSLLGKDGLEIGGPSYIFSEVYPRCHACDNVNYAEHTMWSGQHPESDSMYRRTFINDATVLKDVPSAAYDFVLSSNNLEHIANPLRALREFLRVLKVSGQLVLVVPNKAYNFDHERADTTFEHILKDDRNHVDEHDLTHLEEILEKHDLSMDIPMTKEQFRERCLRNFENRGMHHHVFSLKLLSELAEVLHMKIDVLEKIPANFLLIAEKMEMHT